MSVLKATLICAAGLIVLLFVCPPASSEIYRYKDEKGVWHYSNIRSSSHYKPYLSRASKKAPKGVPANLFQVDRFLIKAIIRAESDFDCRAVSSKGAKGLMQLMPGTADAMEVKNPFDPKENILGGTRYVSLLLKRFSNNKTLALAAYNAGPKVVESSKGIPPYPETKTFVKRVMTYYQSYNGKAERVF
ncbi:MAG: lytic transglycosylase domain-containing protein [Deltaproteobacteria bacterium]|nr:lytic transglycosylase domain-containing protein [Deltaproteobacteria bacterium]